MKEYFDYRTVSKLNANQTYFVRGPEVPRHVLCKHLNFLSLKSGSVQISHL